MKAIGLIRVGSVALALLAWQLLGVTVGSETRDVFPSITDIGAAWWHVVTQGFFPHDVAMTLQEVVTGFSIGSAAGLVVGVLIGASPFMTRVFEPMFFWASGVPKIVLLPILLTILGAGVALKAGHATLSSFFPVTLGTATAIKTLPAIYTLVARTSGTSRLQSLLFVYIPASAGQVLTALRLGLAVSVVSALLAETSVATGGLGWRAIQYYEQLKVAEMYAVILTIFIGAMLVNISFEKVVARYTRHFAEEEVVPNAV